MKRLVLVDGKNMVYRAGFSPGFANLATSRGEPTGVLYGALAMTLALAKLVPETPIVFVWDGGGETWRHRLLSPYRQHKEVKETVAEAVQRKGGEDWFAKQVQGSVSFLGVKKTITTTVEKAPKKEGYKATREIEGSRETREVILAQVPELMRVLQKTGLRNYRIPGLEGDDLIGILTKYVLYREWFEEVVIYSTDHDFYQLMSPKVRVLKNTWDGKLEWVQEDQIRNKYGVGAADWRKYRTLMGDNSDNIPNVARGVGPKTAVKWLQAGFDPSVADYLELPKSARDVVMGFCKSEMQMRELWPRVKRNWAACGIVCDPKAEVFSLEVRERLGMMMGGLSRKELYRDRDNDEEERYRWFTQWLARWEMAEMKERRSEFFALV